ncbi:MAG TPA: hypothetical protein VMJ92_05180, partial [Candidatus Limnocylindrales bacterium]|nr:hypothetical protein [Candidatus Limnocylindrales bacterium]
TDDRDFYSSCGIRLRAHFPDWQRDADRWAREAVDGRHGYGRYSWRICGFEPEPTPPPAPPDRDEEEEEEDEEDRETPRPRRPGRP